MIQKGILNPDILHLLARIRHTNGRANFFL